MSSIQEYLKNKYYQFRQTNQTFLLIIAFIIGVVAGFGAVGIRLLIEIISKLSFPGHNSLLQNISDSPWYIILFMPALGGLLVGPLIHFFAREAKGHGVPEVMQAIILKGGVIRKRVAFVKAIASSITIGTGGSVGREGPIVQIGSSIGSTVGQLFKVPGKRVKTLVASGAAAGIAAAFNAPIAGALFAVEIILMDFAFAQFSPIVLASVTATVISHHFEGNFAAFQVPHYSTATPWEFILYVGLGILSGLVSYLFIKILYFSEDFVDEIKFPEYLKPAIGGLIIGAIGLYFPQVMGVGYDGINDALHGRLLGVLPFLLIFIKIISTSFTLASGGSGGIFAPSLFMGAMLGAAYGSIFDNLLADVALNPGAYALVAMGGLVAGTTRAPITAIIIVFELTNDYRIILPLMITCIISTIISSKLSSESIYTLKLLNRNLNIKAGTDVNILKNIFVKEIFTNKFQTILSNAPFKEIVNLVLSSKNPYFFVVDKKNKFHGIISLNLIKSYLFEKETLSNLLIAGEIADRQIATLKLTDNAHYAQEHLRESEYDCVPVMDTYDEDKIIGVLWRSSIDEAYNQEVERMQIASSFASKIKMSEDMDEVSFMEGYAIAEIPVPKTFIGKSIREINIRAVYQVDVISIRQKNINKNSVQAFPDPNYKFNDEDYIIIAGAKEKLERVKYL